MKPTHLIMSCAGILLGVATTAAAEPILEKIDLFEEQTNVFHWWIDTTERRQEK